MLLGYNTNGFAHHRLEDALVILAELGYRSVALTLDYHALDPFDSNLPRQMAEVKALLTKLQLHSVIETGARFLLDPRQKHQPTLLSYETAAGKRLDFLKAAIDIAQELGSDAVSFWSGAPVEITAAPLLRKSIVNGCRQLCKYAEARSVRLAFEPEPGMYIDTMKRFAWLHQRVDHPSFGLTLDVGHLHCLGEVPIGEHLQCWRDWIWNIHIEDMRRGVHDHLFFGAGEMDFTEVLRGLKEIGYEGGVHVELSRHSHDAVETARKSLAFLRERMEEAG
jgi:L-ribulose-5-phosphate 3-epimerase